MDFLCEFCASCMQSFLPNAILDEHCVVDGDVLNRMHIACSTTCNAKNEYHIQYPSIINITLSNYAFRHVLTIILIIRKFSHSDFDRTSVRTMNLPEMKEEKRNDQKLNKNGKMVKWKTNSLACWMNGQVVFYFVVGFHLRSHCSNNLSGCEKRIKWTLQCKKKKVGSHFICRLCICYIILIIRHRLASEICSYSLRIEQLISFRIISFSIYLHVCRVCGARRKIYAPTQMRGSMRAFCRGCYLHICSAPIYMFSDFACWKTWICRR